MHVLADKEEVHEVFGSRGSSAAVGACVRVQLLGDGRDRGLDENPRAPGEHQGESGGETVKTIGHVELDWVTPRFRDFTPGEFVYRRSGVFAAHGFQRLVVADGQADYLTRVGFRQEPDGWVREVAAA